MRDAKYRIWHIEHKVMFTPEALWFNNPVKYKIWFNNSHEYPKGFRNKIFGYIGKDGILMQYVGLMDKNGVEIYESDWLKYDGTEVLWRVEWCNSSAGWHVVSENGTTGNILLANDNVPEIVGNLHQNNSTPT